MFRQCWFPGAFFVASLVGFSAPVGADETLTTEKASCNVADGVKIKLVMHIARGGQDRSSWHELVLVRQNGSEETVFAGRRSDKYSACTFVDLDNDFLQLVGASIDGDQLSILLSNALGVDILIMRKDGASWHLVQRGQAFSSEERFTTVEVISKGLVYASSLADEKLVWLGDDGQVRRFQRARAPVEPEGPVEIHKQAPGTILWFAPGSDPQTLLGSPLALPPSQREEAVQRARVAGQGMVLWIRAGRPTQEFRAMPVRSPTDVVPLNRDHNPNR